MKFSHEELKKCLGKDQPENVIKLNETDFWIIEAKRNHNLLQTALDEAEDYAQKINQSQSIKAKIVSGVAGNEYDGYMTKTKFCYYDNNFKPITMNGKEVSGLLQKTVAERILRENKPNLEDVPIDKSLFISKAEKINEILHLGAINKKYKATVMASLLLSLIDDTPPNRNSAVSVLIDEINIRARRILKKHEKGNFADFIKISLPPTEDNYKKFRNALVLTLQELDSLNIRSAMNSGTDVLGEFYEVFLKYGNDAKEIGIVLTPRHITNFAAEVLNVNTQDIVYDPTCGTGGFLVAALDHIRKNFSHKEVERFKQNNLIGIDQDPDVLALAFVNMIFRGDGKTHIIEGNCFHKYLNSISKNGIATAEFVDNDYQDRIPPVTKVLMNPPFALKRSDEKEYRFIDSALKQMRDGGILFSVLAYSTMVKPREFLPWRKQLLKNNSLLSIITFPEDLFYPIGVVTVGLFIRKGIPHPNEQNVLWIRALNDGLRKSKGKRLPNNKVPNNLKEIKELLKSFLVSPSSNIQNINKFQKACPIDFSDKLLELVPENYLDEEPPQMEEIAAGVEQLIRDTAAYFVKTKREEIGT